MNYKVLKAILSAAAVAIVFNSAFAAEPEAADPQAIPSAGASAGTKIDPQAEGLLSKACAALGSADAFSFHGEVLFEKVLQNGVKVQFAGEMNFALQRPDELMVEYNSDLGGKRLWYQNDGLTIFDNQHQMYATLKVPSSIDAMLDEVSRSEHLTFPLSDLAYNDPCQRVYKQIIYGGYIGVNDVNGVACDHIAFSSSKVDLQLWLDRSGKPVPRKIVITYRTIPGSPEYIAVLSNWKFPKQFPEGYFSANLPKNAQRIDFLKVREPQP